MQSIKPSIIFVFCVFSFLLRRVKMSLIAVRSYCLYWPLFVQRAVLLSCFYFQSKLLMLSTLFLFSFNNFVRLKGQSTRHVSRKCALLFAWIWKHNLQETHGAISPSFYVSHNFSRIIVQIHILNLLIFPLVIFILFFFYFSWMRYQLSVGIQLELKHHHLLCTTFYSNPFPRI